MEIAGGGRLTAHREAYLGDRKTYRFGSGFWLPDDYGATT